MPARHHGDLLLVLLFLGQIGVLFAFQPRARFSYLIRTNGNGISKHPSTLRQKPLFQTLRNDTVPLEGESIVKIQQAIGNFSSGVISQVELKTSIDKEIQEKKRKADEEIATLSTASAVGGAVIGLVTGGLLDGALAGGDAPWASIVGSAALGAASYSAAQSQQVGAIVRSSLGKGTLAAGDSLKAQALKAIESAKLSIQTKIDQTVNGVLSIPERTKAGIIAKFEAFVEDVKQLPARTKKSLADAAARSAENTKKSFKNTIDNTVEDVKAIPVRIVETSKVKAQETITEVKRVPSKAIAFAQTSANNAAEAVKAQIVATSDAAKSSVFKVVDEITAGPRKFLASIQDATSPKPQTVKKPAPPAPIEIGVKPASQSLRAVTTPSKEVVKPKAPPQTVVPVKPQIVTPELKKAPQVSSVPSFPDLSSLFSGSKPANTVNASSFKPSTSPKTPAVKQQSSQVKQPGVSLADLSSLFSPSSPKLPTKPAESAVPSAIAPAKQTPKGSSFLDLGSFLSGAQTSAPKAPSFTKSLAKPTTTTSVNTATTAPAASVASKSVAQPTSLFAGWFSSSKSEPSPSLPVSSVSSSEDDKAKQFSGKLLSALPASRRPVNPLLFGKSKSSTPVSESAPAPPPAEKPAISPVTSPKSSLGGFTSKPKAEPVPEPKSKSPVQASKVTSAAKQEPKSSSGGLFSFGFPKAKARSEPKPTATLISSKAKQVAASSGSKSLLSPAAVKTLQGKYKASDSALASVNELLVAYIAGSVTAAQVVRNIVKEFGQFAAQDILPDLVGSLPKGPKKRELLDQYQLK